MGAVARQGNNEKTNIKELNFDELCVHNHLHGSVDLLVGGLEFLPMYEDLIFLWVIVYYKLVMSYLDLFLIKNTSALHLNL